MNIAQMSKRIFLLLAVNILVMTTITLVLGLLHVGNYFPRAAWRAWRYSALFGALAAPSSRLASHASWPSG
jgi:hypothetical protein